MIGAVGFSGAGLIDPYWGSEPPRNDGWILRGSWLGRDRIRFAADAGTYACLSVFTMKPK